MNTGPEVGMYPAELWCSGVLKAPWIEGTMGVNWPPYDADRYPAVALFWDAWRRVVPGKTYNVTKGGWTGDMKLLCGNIGAHSSSTPLTFNWCGADPTGYVGHQAWRVPINTGPPKPASCAAYQVPNIDFGVIDPEEISGKKATSQVVVSCDKKASVRVRFMTREGLSIFQMDNGLTTYLKIDDNPGTAGSYQTVAENASSPARAFNLSAELLGTSGSVKPGAFSYTAVVRVDIL
ncbi:hypothetical protein RGI85_003347 [Serratia marcescens]